MVGNTVELTSENFDSKTSKGFWLVDFWAEWCAPCKMLNPIFTAVSDEFKGKINFGKVDVDIQNDLAQNFEVLSIPALLFIKDGEIVDRTVGLISKDALISKIKMTF